MKEVQGKADLSRVESSFFLVKTTFSLHVKHEVTAVDKLDDKEQSTKQHHTDALLLQTKTNQPITNNQLDCLRWFSQRHSHRQVLRARCVRCGVSSDRMALFTFCVMCRDSAKRHILGGCAPRRGATTQVRTRPRFLYNASTPHVSSSYVYSFGSYRVDKQTNKQTPLKISNALLYATTLGNNFISH